MEIVRCLQQNLPSHVVQIRKSRVFTTSALVATSAAASSSALVAIPDEDGCYLVHTFECGPKQVDTEDAFDQDTQEYKLYSWDGVRRFVSAFLAGADAEELCGIAASSGRHRADLRAWPRGTFHLLW